MASKPKNWPDSLPYLRAPLHGKDLTAQHLASVRPRPSSNSSAQYGTRDELTPRIPAGDTPTPSPLVRIQEIPQSETHHPACGQRGLFATRNLKPGTFILVYLGRVHAGAVNTSASADETSSSPPQETPHEESDYDLWLDRDINVAVDASREGNEARFVNDYRGIRARPNAEFRKAWCERWGELCVGVWVLPAPRAGTGGTGGGGSDKSKAKATAGKRARERGEGIKKGEEIVVSYGKGFWEARREAVDEE